MSNDLVESIHIRQFLNDDEIDKLVTWIHNCARVISHVGNKVGDQFHGKTLSNNYKWNFYDHEEWPTKIRELLEPKFEKIFSEKQTVFENHILESLIPYQLHTDYVHLHAEQQIPKYTILIPLQDYDSKTVVFDQYQNDSNEFEKFKETNSSYTTLQLDPRFCMERLSHLHPKDLKYLSLKETFDWQKGDLFAMDRRYFHCSDNFIKRGINKKLGLVFWTGIFK